MDAPGYSWQRLPEQKLLGGVRGEGGLGGEAEGGREGGRGRDSASDVIGSPSASQGGRLNQKKPVWSQRAREGCAARGGRGREAVGRAGPGPTAAAPGREIAAAHSLGRSGELPGESVSACHAKNLGISRSLRIFSKDVETSSVPTPSPFPRESSSAFLTNGIV